MKRLILLAAFACSGFAASAAYIPKEKPAPDSLQSPAPDDDEPVLNSSGSPFHLKLGIDIPVTAVSMGFAVYSFGQIYTKPKSDVATVAALDKQDLWAIDRWGAGKHSDEADKVSNYPFYGSIPYPFLLLLDRSIRKDAFKVYFLYLEAMSITGLLYTGSNTVFNRYRPETYRTDLRPDEKLGGNYRNSFFAGHVALVSTATFFAASIYDTYHPHNRFRWVMYGIAGVATAYTAYLRHIAGKHFPTDIMVGAAIGTLSGILVPHFHRNKPLFNHSWNISPSIGNGYGLSFVYHL